VLILDEAYNGLDATVQSAVKRGVRAWMGGKTVLYITHDLRHAREADRILVIEKGRLVEAGSHDELIEGRGAYSRMYDDFRRGEEGTSAFQAREARS
jgi:ABC-type multidrug transport system fused ATPase/permease subunit